MKKMIYRLLIFFLFFISCAVYQDQKTTDINSSIHLSRIVKELNTPEKISAYMLRHIGYTPDEKRIIASQYDYWWKTPEETFEDKYGFCYPL